MILLDDFADPPERFAITRRIEIDAAHRVPHHRSKCFNVHGHRYVIEAKCAGECIKKGEQTGMVMDFGFLKECMMNTIHRHCDHGIILWENDPLYQQLLDSAEGFTATGFWKIRVIDSVPTAENLARVWYNELCEEIRRFFKDREDTAPVLMDVTVWETPNCKAIYPW